MQAHEFIAAIIRALHGCSANGLGGGFADKERAEFLALPAHLALHLEGQSCGVRVEANGPFLTVSSPKGQWTIHLEVEAKEN